MVKSFICGVEGQVLSEAEREFLAREQPYGVILFARNIADPSQVSALVGEIKAVLNHPFASVLIDQEGGRVARMRPPHWRAYPPALELACKADAARAIYLNARLIAEELRSVGITTDCAPLADVLAPECHAIIGDRAFGDTGEQVATLARAQSDGLRDGGILPVLKHIPGHGRATADSHEALPSVTASLAELEAADFVPFKALRDLPLGMTAHIIYTALDAAHCATVSPIVIDFIRSHIGFDGLLMSDDLSMKALTGSYAERAERTLAAGCDLVLHCNGKMDEMLPVATACVELAGDALRRAEAAARWLPAAPQAQAGLEAEWRALVA
jgi:beta-N-acetylhexosaminidase